MVQHQVVPVAPGLGSDFESLDSLTVLEKCGPKPNHCCGSSITYPSYHMLCTRLVRMGRAHYIFEYQSYAMLVFRGIKHGH